MGRRKKKSFQDWLETRCPAENRSIVEKVWKYADIEWEYFLEQPENYLDTSSGIVGAFIWYSDTKNFLVNKGNLDDVHDYILWWEKHVETLYGLPRFIDGEDQYYDFVLKFVFETIVYDLINYLEEE